MSCATCGRELERGLRFCPMCGRRQSSAFARQSSRPFGGLVGELLTGETLRDWRSALEIVVGLCGAVTEARARGIEVLDLEPDSFYLERRDGWVASILDADPISEEEHDTEQRRAPSPWIHPHAGMATISYLFDGRLVHRDSLGTMQLVERGGVSFMIAGRGIAQSERQPPADRFRESRIHGLELWVALPRPNEDDPASYRYVRAADLPSVVIGGVRVRIVIGEGFGAASPIAFPSPLAMYDIRLPASSAVPMPLPRYHDYQRAVYVVSGAVEIAGTVIPARQLVILTPGESVGVRASGGKPAHIIGLGSAPVLGPRHSWWYFTSTSRARIDEANRRWAADDFGTVTGDGERAAPEIAQVAAARSTSATMVSVATSS